MEVVKGSNVAIDCEGVCPGVILEIEGDRSVDTLVDCVCASDSVDETVDARDWSEEDNSWLVVDGDFWVGEVEIS